MALASALALTAAVVPPARGGVASSRTYLADATAQGTIVISWHGDPARGCAESGMCGERGGVTLRPRLDGEIEVLRVGGEWASGGSGSLSSGDETIVVRARHDEAGRDPSLCIEPLNPGLTIAVAPGARGRVRVGVEPYEGSISAGRCAGPTEVDLARALPAAEIDVDRLRRSSLAPRLAGRRAFTAGSLTGEVTYDVALRIGRLRPGRTIGSYDPGSAPPSSPAPAVEVAYGIERLTARTTADFRGLPELGCDVLDACGTIGVATRRLDAAGGEAWVYADSPTGRAPPTRAAVLRAFRAGRMPAEGSVDPPDSARGSATVEELRPSGAGCRDTALVDALGIEIRTGRGAVRLRPSSHRGPPDPLRARCPGPTLGDVLGDRASSAGTVAPGDLLRSRVTLHLMGSGSFAGRGYGGRHATTIVAELRRTRLTVRPGRR